MRKSDDSNAAGLRVIRTARDERTINRAARHGLRPLIKRVRPSKKIRSKFAVFQHESTGEIKVIHDFRSDVGENYRLVIGWTNYYPHSFPSPYAAYLIPKDIQKGERVWVDDVIEDYVESEWNQGDKFRLQSCDAIWTGDDLEIQFDPVKDLVEMLG